MAEVTVANPPPPADRLTMRGIRKRFGATAALDGVDLAIKPGEVHALVGENGAGKSTLVKVLSGATRADSGAMTLDGIAYQPNSPMGARRLGVAMIYQELSLCPHLSVEANILLGMEPGGLGLVRGSEARRRAADALAMLGHPEIDPAAPVGRLSIAGQQLVEIARAVAVGCRVLVLDEPTSSLTRTDVEKLFALIEKLKRQGNAVIYISHFIEEVRRVADRFTVLRDGGSVGGGATADTSVEGIVQLMVGREVSEFYPRSARTPGEVILETHELAGFLKPQSASFTLRRGEVLGIAGLVGAGRTEMLRAIFGLDPVKRGAVRVGVFSGAASPARRLAQGVGLLSEDRKSEGLALTRTIAENLTLSKMPALVRPAAIDAGAQRWIDSLQIRCRSPRQAVGDLSGGNQQKVAMARLLRHGVDVLLLDEPTRGIDVASKAQIYRLIDDLVRPPGIPGSGAPKAVLMVSSYLPELLGVCDRIAVMHRGRLGPARPVAEVDERTIMLEATGRGAAA